MCPLTMLGLINGLSKFYALARLNLLGLMSQFILILGADSQGKCGIPLHRAWNRERFAGLGSVTGGTSTQM